MSTAGLRTRHPALIVGVALTVIAVDQLTKTWAVNRLSAGRVIDLVGSLRLNLAFNSGAAFSRGSGFGPFIALGAICVVVVLVLSDQSGTSRLGAVAVGLVVGGAIGNLTDRAFRGGPGGFMGGAVVDFVDLQWWPVFNVADSAVVVGGLLLVLTAGLAASRDHDAEEHDPEQVA